MNVISAALFFQLPTPLLSLFLFFFAVPTFDHVLAGVNGLLMTSEKYKVCNLRHFTIVCIPGTYLATLLWNLVEVITDSTMRRSSEYDGGSMIDLSLSGNFGGM